MTRCFGSGSSMLVVEKVPIVASRFCHESFITATTLRELETIKQNARLFGKKKLIRVAEFGRTVQNMNLEGLKTWHSARPFRAFVMRLTDGRRVYVRHPEFLARSPSGRELMVFAEDGSGMTIDLLHVVSIAAAAEKRKTKGGNGRKPKE